MNKYCILLICVLGLVNSDPVPKPKLKGVTIKMEPYARDEDGKIKGFIVDLMDKISEKAGIDYELYFSPDGKYGNILNENPNGMIGEVMMKKADFAVADLTITEARKEKVDFTEPFITNNLAAIIRKEDQHGAKTLEDLIQYNEETAKNAAEHSIAYGVLKLGATEAKIKSSDSPAAKAINQWLDANPNDKVDTLVKGIERVNKGHFALIAESTFAEYYTGHECNLTSLASKDLTNRQYGIALQKGSPYLTKFNDAIKELKSAGTIKELMDRHWINNCDNKQ